MLIVLFIISAGIVYPKKLIPMIFRSRHPENELLKGAKPFFFQGTS